MQQSARKCKVFLNYFCVSEFFMIFEIPNCIYWKFLNKSNVYLILFSFIASGASGAKGRQNKGEGQSDEIRALVPLKANETIFIAVGQVGNSFCQINGVSQHSYLIMGIRIHNVHKPEMVYSSQKSLKLEKDVNWFPSKFLLLTIMQNWDKSCFVYARSILYTVYTVCVI